MTGAPERLGTLYVVATPIGNRDDITLRALETLRRVPLVAAEDTRHSGALLRHHGVAARLVSYHARNQRGRLPQLMAHLDGGADLALVTDAGTPGVSDPGGMLIAAALAGGHAVVALPGPSAVLAALVSSGLDPSRFHFWGFPPRRPGERGRWAEMVLGHPGTGVAFEAPQRTAATLASLAAVSPQREAALARELTKRYEEVWRGTLADLAQRAAGSTPRGEVTLLWAGAASKEPASAPSPATLADAYAAAAAAGERPAAAARRAAASSGLSRREAYRRLHVKPAPRRDGES